MFAQKADDHTSDPKLFTPTRAWGSHFTPWHGKPYTSTCIQIQKQYIANPFFVCMHMLYIYIYQETALPASFCCSSDNPLFFASALALWYALLLRLALAFAAAMDTLASTSLPASAVVLFASVSAGALLPLALALPLVPVLATLDLVFLRLVGLFVGCSGSGAAAFSTFAFPLRVLDVTSASETFVFLRLVGLLVDCSGSGAATSCSTFAFVIRFLDVTSASEPFVVLRFLGLLVGCSGSVSSACGGSAILLGLLSSTWSCALCFLLRLLDAFAAETCPFFIASNLSWTSASVMCVVENPHAAAEGRLRAAVLSAACVFLLSLAVWSVSAGVWFFFFLPRGFLGHCASGLTNLLSIIPSGR